MSRPIRSQTLPRERTTLSAGDANPSAATPTLDAHPPHVPLPHTKKHHHHPHHHQKHRPVSLYDNLRGNVSGSGTLSSASGAVSVGNLAHPGLLLHDASCTTSPHGTTAAWGVDRRSPTQAYCLSTTVPQNIAGLTFAGRHTPTRNSLRHSRMIVQKRRRVSRKYHPYVIRHHRLAKSLVALQTLLGTAVTLLSGWLLIWAPHLNTRDIPYWSGIPLLFSGIMGLTLMCCCRKDYPGKPGGFFNFLLKVFSVFLSTVASVACFCASVFAVIHLVVLAKMSCEPANVLNASCRCQSQNNSTDTQRMFHYIDLNCPEVSNILSVLLIGSAATNVIAGVIAVWYVFLHWHSRYTAMYSEVKTSENNPIVISNKMDPTILNKT